MIHTLTGSNFDEVIKNADDLVMVDFWASWCGPCKMLSPIVDEIADEYPHITVGKVNVDEAPDVAAAFRVMSIPTLVFFKNGEKVKTSVGYITKNELEEIISQL